MNEMQVFNHSEFGELGVIMIGGREYFPATACAKILGYSDPYDAINRHTKGSVKRRVLTAGGEQEQKLIPEGDLYRLIIRSKLPAAPSHHSYTAATADPAAGRYQSFRRIGIHYE